MSATEWDRKLIADLAAERTGLGEPEVVGVRGLRPHTRHACWAISCTTRSAERSSGSASPRFSRQRRTRSGDLSGQEEGPSRELFASEPVRRFRQHIVQSRRCDWVVLDGRNQGRSVPLHSIAKTAYLPARWSPPLIQPISGRVSSATLAHCVNCVCRNSLMRFPRLIVQSRRCDWVVPDRCKMDEQQRSIRE
jgi:hypothetical protein